jgi:hypothetical protein
MRSAPHTLIQQFGKLGGLEQRLEWRLIDAVFARHAAHVVDDERQRQCAHHRRQRLDAGGVEMQHDVPAAALDAVEDAVEHDHVGRAAEMLDEIGAHAAHAAFVEPVEIGIGEAVVDDGDAAIAFGVGGDAVEHRQVVGAVAARLHDHRARPACSGGSARKEIPRPGRTRGSGRRSCPVAA